MSELSLIWLVHIPLVRDYIDFVRQWHGQILLVLEETRSCRTNYFHIGFAWTGLENFGPCWPHKKETQIRKKKTGPPRLESVEKVGPWSGTVQKEWRPVPSFVYENWSERGLWARPRPLRTSKFMHWKIWHM